MTFVSYSKLIDRMKRIRTDVRGYTQEEVAEALGVDQPVYSRLERKVFFMPDLLQDALMFLTANKIDLDRMVWGVPVREATDEEWEEFQREVEARKAPPVQKVEDGPPSPKATRGASQSASQGGSQGHEPTPKGGSDPQDGSQGPSDAEGGNGASKKGSNKGTSEEDPSDEDAEESGARKQVPY
jgi:transcriptional regulator with XRE-family HTH domain